MKYWAILAFSWILPCLAASFPDYPVGGFSDYPNSVEKDGVKLAAVPLDNPKQQKTYFKLDLRARGFLPVFVVLENGSAADSFVLKIDSVTYGEPPGVPATPLARSQGDAIAIMAVGGVLPGFAFATMGMASQAADAQQNIRRKKLRSMTLGPGQSGHGFVYLPVPKDGARDKIRLAIPVLRSGTDQNLLLDVTF